VTKASGARATPRTSSPRPPTKGGSTTTTSKRARKDAKPSVPDTPGIARIIAIANQKGGVGKSTTAVSLGAALADLGFRVLVVDLDPQGNASTGMGIKHEAREITVYDVIVAEAPVGEAIVETPVLNLHAVPSTIDLAGAEIELVSRFSRETRLKKALSAVREGVYDFILLDCPPSLGLLTINALTAAEELIVPIQCEYYALEGVGQLLRNVSLVQQNINPGLRLSGIVMTMFDPRTKLSEQVVEEVQRYFGDLVYDIIIPRTVRLSEAPGYGQPITVYDPKSKGAECYRELGREVALRPPPVDPMPTFDDLPAVVLPALDVERGAVQAPPIDEDEITEIPTVRAVMVEADEGSEATVPVGQQDELESAAVNDDVTEAVEDVIDEMEASKADPPLPSRAEPVSDPPDRSDSTSAGPLPGGPPDDPRIVEDVDQTQDDDEGLWEEEDSPTTPAARVKPPSSPAPPGHLPDRRVVVIDEDAEAAPEPPSRADPSSEVRSDPGDVHPAVADIGATLEDDGSNKRRWRLFRKGGD
jgi:chromosome partitioning protein